MKRYQQIAGDITAQVDQGLLAPGKRIPSVRQASRQQQASVATILRAYELLEQQGVIEARPQSGYYVRAHPRPQLREPEVSRPGLQATEITVSELILKVLASLRDVDILPLGSAFPSPELFPYEKLNRFLRDASRHYDPWSSVRDLPPGNPALIREIARRYLETGLHVPAEEIIVTCGATEALNLSLKAVARPGDTIAVESPTFYGLLQAIERAGMRVLEVPTHPREGLDLAALSRLLKKHRVSACMFSPTFQNPIGSLMPDAARQELVALLARHEIPMIEDDVYRELYFGARPPRPAKAFDTQGLVLHCGSFSKCLAPGYRVGWVAAGRFARKVAQLKFSNTLATPSLPQAAIARYLSESNFERHLRRLRSRLAAQEEALAEAVRHYFPAATRMTRPAGGYVLWVELPGEIDTVALHAAALQHNISIAPGPMFSATGAYQNCLRLNFGHPWSAGMEQGMAALGQLIAGGRTQSAPRS